MIRTTKHPTIGQLMPHPNRGHTAFGVRAEMFRRIVTSLNYAERKALACNRKRLSFLARTLAGL